ncbi:hypothetical protein GGF46_000729 [Coemansia sp. RSA 552]|nr:hypothetical protein GGF46_000729 [Coemansia sp. RSA 552]
MQGRGTNLEICVVDRVFDYRDTTQKVYGDVVKSIIASSLGGFNGTIFAYGQTSSGKTHTMYGGDTEAGIIKLAVDELFETVRRDTGREYLIRVSFLEIYNEVLRDLLEPTKTNLKIHENAKREIFVGDLSEHIVFNADQVEEVLQKGDRNRHIAGTNMNERSSRSHTIFRIVIESREKASTAEAAAADDGSNTMANDNSTMVGGRTRLSTDSLDDSEEFTGAVMVSCLNLVDLAGSERVRQTGAEGQRLKEGAHINRSLLSLGTVIARLSEDGGDCGHVPYRDSKLTRILQPSLGGNAKTLIICTITASPDYVDETLSTLKFASRAKTIRNMPEVNEELRGDALLRRLKRASELEKEVAQMKEIERRKIQIEADNESLLRQLWRSQKERERLQYQLERQQSSVFLPRTADGQAVSDEGNVRRQTWFPGLQGPVSEDTAAMDVDYSAPAPEPEPARCDPEMQATLDRVMREYSLLLATLGQLADANEVPPSPAKPGADPQPRELVLIRRKIRALMTTISASQKQCRKFRSQRPEAAFLELELQAVRETLAEKEEELVAALRESDDVFSRLTSAEDAHAALEQDCSELRDELQELRNASCADKTAQAEHERTRQVELALACDKLSEAEQRLQSAQQYHHELSAELDSVRTQSSQQKQAAEAELTAMRADMDRLREQGHELQIQLSISSERATALAEGCQAATEARQAKELEVEQFTAVLQELQARLTSQDATIGDMAREAELKSGQVHDLSARVAELQAQGTEAEAVAKSQIAAHTLRAGEMQAAIDKLTVEIQELDAKRIQADQDRMRTESELESARAGVADAAQLAGRVAELERDLDERQAKLDAAGNERKRACTTIEQLESQSADLWDRVSELVTTNEELTTKVSGTEDVAARQAERISTLEKEAADLAQAHGAARQELERKSAALQADLDARRAELERVHAELAESQDRCAAAAGASDHQALQASELTHELSRTKSLLGESQAALDSMRADYSALEQSVAQLKEQAADRKRQLDECVSREQQAKETVRQLENSLDATRSQQQAAQAGLDEKTHAEAAAVARSAELESQLSSKRELVAHIEARAAELDGSLSQALRNAAELQKQLADTEERWVDERSATETHTAGLRQTISEHLSTVASLESQIACEQTTTAQLRQQIESRQEAETVLEQRLRTTAATEADSRKRVAVLEEELASAANASSSESLAQAELVADLRAQVDSLEHQAADEHAQAQEAIQATAEAQKALQKEMEELQSTHDAVCQDLSRARDARTELEKQLESSTATLSQQLAEAQASHRTEADSLQERLDCVLEELSRTDSIAKAGKVSLAQLQQDRDAKHSECEQLQARVDSALQQNKEATAKLSAAERALETTKQAEVESTARASELAEQLGAKSAQCQSLSAACEELKISYDSFVQRAQTSQAELEQTVAALESELTSKKIALADMEAALDNASASAETAQAEALRHARAGARDVEAQLEERQAALEQLDARHSQSLADIDTLKTMMTALAEAKDGEIGELEQAIEQHKAILESSVSEGLEKDDVIQRLEAANTELSKQGAGADAVREELEAQRLREIEALTSQQREAQDKLDRALASVDRLQAEAEQHEQARAELGQKHAQLSTANEKLERKNDKLRDMYKADTAQLHAEEGKQRQRAEQLAEDLAEALQKAKALEEQLARAQEELARLQARSSPAKTDRKRVYSAAESTAAMLSPVPPSRLNARVAAHEAAQAQDPAPPRKRTAAEPKTASVPKPAEAPRAHSTYGERRRTRRNQPAPPPVRAGGLEEQTADQCVQQ